MNLTVRRYASEYFVDHLGNLRVSCRCGEPKCGAQGVVILEGQPGVGIETISVVQEQHYDAWGLAFSSVGSSVAENLKDKFKYNGNEEVEELEIVFMVKLKFQELRFNKG
jgi:hypothetical protein